MHRITYILLMLASVAGALIIARFWGHHLVSVAWNLFKPIDRWLDSIGATPAEIQRRNQVKDLLRRPAEELDHEVSRICRRFGQPHKVSRPLLSHDLLDQLAPSLLHFLAGFFGKYDRLVLPERCTCPDVDAIGAIQHEGKPWLRLGSSVEGELFLAALDGRTIAIFVIEPDENGMPIGAEEEVAPTIQHFICLEHLLSSVPD